jgi:hypothetical protein
VAHKSSAAAVARSVIKRMAVAPNKALVARAEESVARPEAPPQAEREAGAAPQPPG